MKSTIIALCLSLSIIPAIQGQTNLNTMKNKPINNPLICDINTGLCESDKTSYADNVAYKVPAATAKLKLIYFTDPICSSCWGIEPQLRKLKLEYGEHIEIEYKMGGLLPNWEYNSGGISKPSDVAHHWDEVSIHYDMPIDGDIWLEDPLSSSYPPSIAFKAAQMQDEKKATQFMREMREMLFLKKKNLAKWEYMAEAAKEVGLDVAQFKIDYEGDAIALFEADLALSKTYGVRGFPTIFVIAPSGKKETVYGAKPYAFYEVAILTANPNIQKTTYSTNWESLFEHYPTLTAMEYSVLSGKPRIESEQILNELSNQGKLEKLTTKNGSMWSKK